MADVRLWCILITSDFQHTHIITYTFTHLSSLRLEYIKNDSFSTFQYRLIQEMILTNGARGDSIYNQPFLAICLLSHCTLNAWGILSQLTGSSLPSVFNGGFTYLNSEDTPGSKLLGTFLCFPTLTQTGRGETEEGQPVIDNILSLKTKWIDAVSMMEVTWI